MEDIGRGSYSRVEHEKHVLLQAGLDFLDRSQTKGPASAFYTPMKVQKEIVSKVESTEYIRDMPENTYFTGGRFNEGFQENEEELDGNGTDAGEAYFMPQSAAAKERFSLTDMKIPLDTTAIGNTRKECESRIKDFPQLASQCLTSSSTMNNALAVAVGNDIFSAEVSGTLKDEPGINKAFDASTATSESKIHVACRLSLPGEREIENKTKLMPSVRVMQFVSLAEKKESSTPLYDIRRRDAVWQESIVEAEGLPVVLEEYLRMKHFHRYQLLSASEIPPLFCD